MLRCSLCLFVLISLVGTVSVAAWRIRPPGLVHCREVQRQCELECGRGKCTVKRRCCLKGAKICYDQTKVETVCNSFQCLNGGTRLRTNGCEVQAPICQCPAGFSGACCQNNEGSCPAFLEIALLPCGNDTCKTDSDCQGRQKCCDRYCSRACVNPTPVDPCESVKCSTGKECRTVPVKCMQPPCPSTTICIPTNKPGTCPSFVELARLPCGNDTCKTDADCQGQQKCCDKFCSRHCVNPEIVGLCGLFKCPKGTVCKKVPGLCKSPPCPERPMCVQNNKLGTCPALKDKKSPCHYNCMYDSDCPGKEKCCKAGCSRECTKPGDADPCARVDCGPNKKCTTAVIPCLIAPCLEIAKCVPTNAIGKPGVCPSSLGLDILCKRIIRSCKSDQDCVGDKKCCLLGCSAMCVDAVQPPNKTRDCNIKCKPGFECQESPAPCLEIPNQPCKPIFKCVPTVRPGACPDFPGFATDCGFRIRRICKSDNECPWGHKCCSRGCEQKECYRVIPDSKTN
jgi:hypothetical protein